MKKMSVVFLGLLLAVLVMGCGIYESYGFDYKQLSSIERGMSFKEVCTILGEPAFRDLNKEERLDIPRLYSCGVVGCQGVVQRRKSGRNEELSGGYLSGYHFAGQKFHGREKRIFRQE